MTINRLPSCVGGVGDFIGRDADRMTVLQMQL